MAALGLVLALAVGGVAARAAGDAPRVLALPPRADARTETLARGGAEWVREQLAAAGLPSASLTPGAAGLPLRRPAILPPAPALAALASEQGAERLWVLELRDPDGAGHAIVRLLIVDAGGALLAAGRGEAPLGRVGEALAEATRALTAGAGLRSDPPRIPTAAELDAYGRALAALEAGRYADAWDELASRLTPLAETLRARIQRVAQAGTLPLGERARLAIAFGDAERARLWMRTQLRDSRDPALVLAAAEAAEGHADWPRALQLHERALALDPQLAAAAVGRARALARLGRFDEAALVLAGPLPEGVDPVSVEAVLDQPGFTAGAGVLARIHGRLAAIAGRRFDAERATQHLAQVVRLDPAQEGPAQAEAAVLRDSLGDVDGAREAAERAVALGSAAAPVWEVLGRARSQSGDAEGARQAFEQARELAPDHAAPLEGLAELAAASGDDAGAVELLRQAVALAPEHTRSRIRLAGLLRVVGDVDGAMAVLEGAPAREPSSELLRQEAALRLERGDAENAADLLSRAIELEPESAALHGELARVEQARGDGAAAAEQGRLARRFGGGDEAGAPGAASDGDGGDAEALAQATAGTLDALVASFPERLAGRSRPVEVVALLPLSVDPRGESWLRWLRPRRVDLPAVTKELVRALGERFEVVGPDEIPRELERADQERLRTFAGGEESVARVNHALGTDAVFVARVARGAKGQPGALGLELRMGVGSDAPVVRRFQNQGAVPGGAARFAAWNPTALLIYSLALLLASLPVLRGWGELVVAIEYASLGKGFFSIKLARRPVRAEAGSQRGRKAREGRFARRGRLFGRYQRQMVGRETRFKWLPARRYYVAVHGLLQDPVSEEVVGNYFAEKPVVLRRGRAERVDFDFRPRECALEVCVFRGEEPVSQATLALRGRPDSLRYARDGRTLLYLAPGRYRVLVGLEDRVLEREIHIEGFAPRSLAVSVDDPSALLFTGTPDAVEAYLLGNLAAAADALEQAGDAVAAARVRGEYWAGLGERQRAARCFQQAGCFEEAAALADDPDDPTSAARLYAQAGNHEKAAEAFRQAGDPLHAAEEYEEIYRYDEALDCYREAGHLEKVCELGEKLANYLEAARVAVELGEMDRAIRNLQSVEVRDGDYGPACQLLGRIFAERGESELALQKLGEAIEVAGGSEDAPLELLEEYAAALERADRLEPALAAYEAIRARDFHRPQISTRIERLRKVLSQAKTVVGAPSDASTAGESRYELIQEVGRGGMGVVYKARDKRLGRVVALKRLPDNLRNHPTAVRLFLREARAAAALNHRNIVTLFDAGQEGDVYFLTMEFLEGFPLHELLARRKRLSARDVARLGAQVAAGLEYAHARGIVHRDIKTSNLFFTTDRVVKIMDFGLAKMTEEVRRAATVVGGTPYYMAPEQAAGEDVDARADLYAFGVTLFELLTGSVPFRDGDVARHHRETPPPDPRTLVAEVPEPLAGLILRLMAKRPEDRLAATGEVAAGLVEIAKQLSS